MRTREIMAITIRDEHNVRRFQFWLLLMHLDCRHERAQETGPTSSPNLRDFQLLLQRYLLVAAPKQGVNHFEFESNETESSLLFFRHKGQSQSDGFCKGFPRRIARFH